MRHTYRAHQKKLSATTSKQIDSSERLKIIWVFDMLDRNGIFAFNINRPDFDHKEFLDKLLAYSNMTWSQVRAQTHDNGKSKHHFLNNIDKLSKEAKERLEAKKLAEYTDSIFSFALNNKLRIIGIREREFFHVIWYDPEHQFHPSQK